MGEEVLDSVCEVSNAFVGFVEGYDALLDEANAGALVGGDCMNGVAVVGEEEPLNDEEVCVVDEGERQPWVLVWL